MFSVIKQISKLECFFVIVLSMGAVVICFMSPLHLFSRSFPSSDSAYHLYTGIRMLGNDVPYLDFSEAAGPVMAIIQWLGMLIAFRGVWLLQIAAMIVSVIVCYCTGRRFFGEWPAFLGTAITFVAIVPWYDGGNRVFDFALPFLFGGLYCLTGYWKRSAERESEISHFQYELSRRQVFVFGLCIGVLLMLQFDLAIPLIGVFIAICIHTGILPRSRKMSEKTPGTEGEHTNTQNGLSKRKLIFRYVLTFVLGSVAIIAPIMLWLAISGAYAGFYRDYVYPNIFPGRSFQASEILSAFTKLLSYVAVAFNAAIILFLLLFPKWRKRIDFSLYISVCVLFALSICCVLLSGSSAVAQNIILLPCFALFFAFAFSEALKYYRFAPWSLVLLALVVSSAYMGEAYNNARMTRRVNATLFDVNNNDIIDREPNRIVVRDDYRHAIAENDSLEEYINTHYVVLRDNSYGVMYVRKR